MIEVVRKIKEEDLAKQIKAEHGLPQETLDTYDALIEAFTEKRNFTKENLADLHDNLAALETRLNGLAMPHYNWFQKNILKRRQYLEEKERLIATEEQLRSKIEKCKADITSQNSTDSMYEQTIENIRAEMGKRTLSDFGLDYKQAVELITSHGERVVLTEEDKESIIARPDFEIDSLDKLVLVHKTSHAPTNSTIITTYDAYKQGKIEPKNVDINGSNYQYKTPLHARDTVHAAVNGPVRNHKSGNDWDSMPYAIFIPFNSVKDQIVEAAPMDTYTQGSISLTEDTIVLCPEDKVDKILIDNPILKKENVLGFEGTRALGFEDFVISNIMGIKPEKMGDWAWSDTKDQVQYESLMKSNGFSINPHSSTSESIEEVMRAYAISWANVIKFIRENELIKNESDINKVYEYFEHREIEGSSILPKVPGYSQDLFYRCLSEEMESLGLSMANTLINEELEYLGISTTDETKTLFNKCFSDIYTPRVEAEKEVIVNYFVNSFCVTVKSCLDGSGDIEYACNRIREEKVKIMNKPLSDMSLSDFLSIYSSVGGFASKTHLIVTNPELISMCNQNFEENGLPINLTPENLEQYKNMDPQIIPEHFFRHCCNLANQYNDNYSNEISSNKTV